MTGSTSERPLLIGATASDPRHSVMIWNTIRGHFAANGIPVEYALYSTYDALCDHLLRGIVDIAWNAPMAHAQALLAGGGRCRTLAMRDTDDGVHTLLVARADAGIEVLDDLRGRRVAMGVDVSSELWLLPAAELRAAGLDPATDCELVDLEPTLYPNLQEWVDDRTIFEAVVDGRADAGVIFEPWLSPLLRRHGLEPDDITEVWRSTPYCHCAFTGGPDLDQTTADRFVEVLLSMDPEDPEIAEMMRREHLSAWVPATDSGWATLMTAIRDAGLEGRVW